nr:acyl carrier protein [Dictyobacter kobayashii]
MFAHLLANRQDSTEATNSAHVQKKLITSVLQLQRADEREQLVQSYLREHIARILRIPIAKLDLQRPLHTLGIDSLMAVELKNQIEVDTEITVPVVLLLQGTSIRELTNFLLAELAAKAAPVEQLAPAEEVSMSDALTR